MELTHWQQRNVHNAGQNRKADMDNVQRSALVPFAEHVLTYVQNSTPMYLRVDCGQYPEDLLSGRVIIVAAGGTLDVLCTKDSSMGRKVEYSIGIIASKKLTHGSILYRFRVPEGISRGATFAIHGGFGSPDGFSFKVQVK